MLEELERRKQEQIQKEIEKLKNRPKIVLQMSDPGGWKVVNDDKNHPLAPQTPQLQPF